MSLLSVRDVNRARALFGEHFPIYEAAMRTGIIPGSTDVANKYSLFLVHDRDAPVNEQYIGVQGARILPSGAFSETGNDVRFTTGHTRRSGKILVRNGVTIDVCADIAIKVIGEDAGKSLLLFQPQRPERIPIDCVLPSSVVTQYVENALYHKSATEFVRTGRTGEFKLL